MTPLFSIGASLGVILAGFMGLPVMLAAALGYAAVFGSATNTLLAPFSLVQKFSAMNICRFLLWLVWLPISSVISLLFMESRNMVPIENPYCSW